MRSDLEAAIEQCDREMERLLKLEKDTSPSALMGIGDFYIEKQLLLKELREMKMRETALWKSLAKCIPPDCMAERIENSANSMMPDVLLAYRGKTVLVELKVELNGITRGQADWARRWAAAGGISWFLIAGANRSLYLVPGDLGVRLLRQPDITYGWAVANCREAVEKMFE